MNGVICGNLLESLATTDCLHGDSGLELRAVDAAFAHEWEPPSQGRYPASRLTMGPVQKNQTTSVLDKLLRCSFSTRSHQADYRLNADLVRLQPTMFIFYNYFRVHHLILLLNVEFVPINPHSL